MLFYIYFCLLVEYVCFIMCLEPGLVPHEAQSRSPMTEYSGPAVAVSYAGVDPAVRQPYQRQMRPAKPGSCIWNFHSSC